MRELGLLAHSTRIHRLPHHRCHHRQSTLLPLLLSTSEEGRVDYPEAPPFALPPSKQRTANIAKAPLPALPLAHHRASKQGTANNAKAP
jgi:hypothetical protein